MINFAHAWRSGWSYEVGCPGKRKDSSHSASVPTTTIESSGTEDKSKVSRI